MANPIDPRPERFRAQLDDGEIVETDGSTVADPVSGGDVPAVLLRMSPARAHALAGVLEDWCRVALVFATLRSSEATERVLAWALAAGATAAGAPGSGPRDPGALATPSVHQRLAAVAVLSEREQRMSAVQQIAVVDAAARWLAEDAGEELARALLEAACSEPATASFVYLALIEQPGTAA
jgi:hypothetical protein